jgi:hypothetical protein
LTASVRNGEVLVRRRAAVPFSCDVAANGEPFPDTEVRRTRLKIALVWALEAVIMMFNWMDAGGLHELLVPSRRVLGFAEAVALPTLVFETGISPAETKHDVTIPPNAGRLTLIQDERR